jgi:hypothetical protein
MGGQLTLPYEQNTQQSPFLGLRIRPQFEHSQKTRQESVGIISSFLNPHSGHVIIDVNCIIYASRVDLSIQYFHIITIAIVSSSQY